MVDHKVDFKAIKTGDLVKIEGYGLVSPDWLKVDDATNETLTIHTSANGRKHSWYIAEDYGPISIIDHKVPEPAWLSANVVKARHKQFNTLAYFVKDHEGLWRNQYGKLIDSDYCNNTYDIEILD